MHHIARNFAKAGWNVGFLSAPIGLPHLLGAGTDAAQRVASWRSGGSRDPVSSVWHYVPFAPMPWGISPLLARRTYVAAAWLSARAGVQQALRRAGLYRPDFACADHFLHEGLLRAAAPRISAFRRADNAAGFPGALPDFAEREADFARRADLTIVTNRDSAAEMTEMGVVEPMLVRNGLALERFFTQHPTLPEYAQESRPIIVYAGAADQRLDDDLLVAAVRARPQYCWVFIGPFGGVLATRLLDAGARLLGPIPHEELAAHLQHARIGLVPFSRTRCQNLIREVSPLKVFEYAACGLPIVGTRGCIYPEDLPTPLSICDSYTDFLGAIDHHIHQPAPAHVSAESFRNHGWDQRLAPLLQWLDTRLVAAT